MCTLNWDSTWAATDDVSQMHKNTSIDKNTDWERPKVSRDLYLFCICINSNVGPVLANLYYRYKVGPNYFLLFIKDPQSISTGTLEQCAHGGPVATVCRPHSAHTFHISTEVVLGRTRAEALLYETINLASTFSSSSVPQPKTAREIFACFSLIL